ncbi:heavy metal-associated isoprenylated plant protein 35-like [Gastrolobium bilobum]|uniref:heavy metal-associated isoprenylated plant protein 35-like n=1 Tax=Gastrolobium bilobum TaxID=150636 RepID=UPI002AB1EBBD|nr:heavy metal-associated isoprenylated plant protein 35-like [Gastrolobium bilobum]
MSAEVASQPLKYQTWLLKVSIHCDGCRRKVKKVLQSIDGVFTTTVDAQQHKVTVTGSVGVEILIRKLVKAGKHAEIWPENLAGKGKTSCKAKKNNEQRDPESKEKHSATNAKKNLISGKSRGIESADKYNNESNISNSKTGGSSPENSPPGGLAPEPDRKGGKSEGGTGKSGGEGSGKRKKKKGQSGGSGSNGLSSASTSAPAHTGFQFQCPDEVVGQVNLSPTRQQSYPYPVTYYPPLVYFATYNRLCPMGTMGGPSYYVPPSPYMYAGMDQYPCQMQSTPLVSFEIFSDDNANGCSIM